MVATGAPAYFALNAAMACNHGVSDASNVFRRAMKYDRWLGRSSERSAAITLATAGIVLGSYQRCGFGVLLGNPRTCWATMTLRWGSGEAASTSFMNVS